MHKVLKLIVVALLLGALPARAATQTIYVAANGDDQWSGLLPSPNEQGTDGPMRSLAAAVQQSRKSRRHAGEEIQLLLSGGIYPLADPLILTGRDSGLVIAAAGHESPVITGQTGIRGWRRSSVNPNVWETEIPDARDNRWIFHELFFNGQRKERTRVPERGFLPVDGKGIKGQPAELNFRPGDIQAEWAQPGDVELVAITSWAEARNQIREVSAPLDIVTLAGRALANQGDASARYYIENAPVELRPGQWHLDASRGLLTYWPDAGENMRAATITAPHLYNLVRIEGHADNVAHHIAFRGLTFADTDWKMEDGSDVDIQGAVEVPGAVRAQFARDCAFERCTFERMGGYALELDGGCEEDRIVGNDMFDLGAGGIRVGESKMDQAVKFPCGHHVLTDNHIHDIGRVQMPGMGILLLLSDHNLISHNEVDHTFQTAISVGWSWGFADNPCHDNIVEYNFLHDIGQGQTSDMGGVYTLGVQPGTIVRNNLIRDVNCAGYGGWGLYLDEGSSGIVMESNIVYRCQSAGFHQHYGRTNVIRNNIFAFNGEAQLARTRIEPFLSFIFTNNIVYFDTGDLLTGNWGDDVDMDHNFYFDTRPAPGDSQSLRIFGNWQKRGHDLHSLFADPLFVAPRRGNFRLQPDSPALAGGFHQIDLTRVGIRPRYRSP